MSITTCKFQVGCINRLELDDPTFENIWDALGFAVTWAGSVDLDRDEGIWIGVWVDPEMLGEYFPWVAAIASAGATGEVSIFWVENVIQHLEHYVWLGLAGGVE